VNIDTRNVERPRAWLDQAGVKNLAYYTDQEAKIFQDLRRAGLAEGMPTTILIDRPGAGSAACRDRPSGRLPMRLRSSGRRSARETRRVGLLRLQYPPRDDLGLDLGRALEDRQDAGVA
jgi:hypothetical protein